MRAPSTVEVSCPACGEPIEFPLSMALVDPEPGALVAHVDVHAVDVEQRAQSHAEVCGG